MSLMILYPNISSESEDEVKGTFFFWGGGGGGYVKESTHAYSIKK